MHGLLLCSSSAISQLGVEEKRKKGPLPYSPSPRCLNRKLPDASLSPELCWVIEQMSWEGGGWEIEVEQSQKFHSVFHYKTWWEPEAGIMWCFFVRECGCRKHWGRMSISPANQVYPAATLLIPPVVAHPRWQGNRAHLITQQQEPQHGPLPSPKTAFQHRNMFGSTPLHTVWTVARRGPDAVNTSSVSRHFALKIKSRFRLAVLSLHIPSHTPANPR